MRVAIVTESFLPRTDGVVRTVLELLQYLRARNHEALVFAAGPGPTLYEGYHVVRAPGPRFPRYPALTVAPYCPRMTGRLRTWKPDVIHLASPFVLGVQGCMAGHLIGVPVAAHYQTDVARYARHFGLGLLEGAARWHLKHLHNACHLNYAPTESVRRDMAAQGVQGMRVLGRGVDSVLFTPAKRSEALRRSLLQAGEETLLLYVGRISTEKNLEALASLITSVPRSRLVLVGEGPHRETLAERFRGLPVTFLGLQHGEDLATIYASADIFAFPSLTETFGQVVQEAMASGLPVLVFAAGGVQDLLSDGQEGFVCPLGDVRQWDAAAKALAHDGALRARFGARARATAAERTWSAVFDRLLRDYAELADQHGTPWQAASAASAA